MTTPAKVLRVFLSSTASDMTACREKVRDAVLQLEHLPIGMETFTALPTLPAKDCQAKAAEADVVIVMVAYRFGYVPSVELGGDGERSITWLEVLAAKAAGKPVFAFLIDPKAGWSQPKEVDRLNTEPKERRAEVLAAIDGLNDFKAYLQQNCTFDTFANEDDLARKVGAALVNYVSKLDRSAARPARVWQPRVCYPLQPAPHFQGRERLRSELVEWAGSRVSPDRVVSLVAVGGTGKTALAERVVTEICDSASTPTPSPLRGEGRGEGFASSATAAGLLVWSFYENTRTEEFLRTACEYFTGETPTSAGGLLERLQVALAGDEPHLLVLDGLERVQAEGTTGRPRGELEDPQLRRLVRWLAAGQGTRTRALVTSRFPLVDLDDWKHAGHREERLEDLEPAAARAVLRGWDVKGDDATLDGLAAPLGYHALSVAVLGSYLGKLWGGDPTKAPTFDRGELAAADPKAAKLTRILTHYAEKLPDAERDLLARLSTFPRGVTVEFLGFLIDAGDQIAGALAGCNQVRLLTLLEQLRNLGLVFRYDTRQGDALSAHPFLRGYFREHLLSAKSEEIHEVVRARLVSSLQTKPVMNPTDSSVLDWYETLIEETRLSGRTLQAYELYWNGLGNFKHLSLVLGESTRGLRIVTGFAKEGDLANTAPELTDSDRGRLIADWGLYALVLGELQVARRAFEVALNIFRHLDDADNCGEQTQNIGDVELFAGKLPAASEAGRRALMEAERSKRQIQKEWAHGYFATAMAWLGDLGTARQHFSIATDLARRPLYSWRGIREADVKLTAGDRSGALSQTKANYEVCVRNHWTRDEALCRTLLGLLVLPEDPAMAQQYLDGARDFAFNSGHVDVQLRCYHLAAEIARAERAYDLARSEAEAGIHLADTCGFGHYAIELRLALARAQLDASEAKAALQRAREALDRSVHPECQYAWGEADGLHLCGVAHARLGELDLARTRLTAAVAKRGQLTHPGLAETRAELARIGV